MADQLRVQLNVDFSALNKDFKTAQAKAKKVQLNLGGIKDTRKEMGSIIGQIEQATSKVALWTIATGALFASVRKVKEGFAFINELNKSLTEVSIVTGETRQQTERLAESYNDLAFSAGTVTDAVAEASVAFFRQGKETEEVLQLTENAIKASSIASLDLKQTVELLTATVNGFGLSAEESILAIDKFSAVSASAATSFEELATASARVASSANATGVSIDSLTAFIATVSEVTRESSQSIGNSFKTIFARFTKITKGMEDEGVAINDVEKALNSVDVALRASDNSFRNLDDVLFELGSKWESLSDTNRAYLATTIAGTRQQNRFLALMENINRATELQEIALNSAGVAQRQYGAFLESNEAAFNRLEAATQKLFIRLIDSEFIKDFTESLTSLVLTVDNVIEKFGGLSTAGLFLLPIIGTKLVKAWMLLNTAVITLNVPMLAFQTILVALPALIFAVTRAEQQRQEAFKQNIENVKTLKAENEQISNLRDRMSELQSISDKTTEQKEELAKVQEDLARLYPEVASGITEEGNAIAGNINIVNAKIDANKKLLESELILATVGGANRIKEINEELDKRNARQDELNQKLSEGDVIQEKTFRRAGKEFDVQIDLTSQLTDESRNNIDAMSDLEIELNSLEQSMKLLNEIQKEANADAFDFTDELNREKDTMRETGEVISETAEIMEFFAKETSEVLNILTEMQLRQRDLNHELDIQNEFLSRLEATDENRIPILEKIISLSKQQQGTLHSLANAERAKIASGELNAEQIQDSQKLIQSLGREWQELETSIISANKEINQIPIDIAKEKVKGLKDGLKELTSELDELIDSQIENLENERGKAVSVYEEEIELIEDKIKAISEENDERERAIRIAELEENLLKSQQKLANVEAEKNTRILIGDQFVYVADPRAVQQAQEELVNNQKALDEQLRKDAEDKRIADLQAELDKLKEEKDNEEKSFNERISNLKSFQKDYQSQIEKDGKIQESLLSSIYDSLGDINSTYFENTINGFKNMINQINESMEDIKSVEEAIETTSSGSSSSKKSDRVVVSDGNKTYNLDRKAYESGKSNFDKAGFKEIGSARTGASVLSDGLVYLHKGEQIVPNEIQPQIADIANYGFNPMNDFMNGIGSSIPNITPSSVSNSQDTIIENMSISLPNVQNAKDFATEFQDMKRLFATTSGFRK